MPTSNAIVRLREMARDQLDLALLHPRLRLIIRPSYPAPCRLRHWSNLSLEEPIILASELTQKASSTGIAAIRDTPALM